jgi:hypothetical protein
MKFLNSFLLGHFLFGGKSIKQGKGYGQVDFLFDESPERRYIEAIISVHWYISMAQ